MATAMGRGADSGCCSSAGVVGPHWLCVLLAAEHGLGRVQRCGDYVIIQACGGSLSLLQPAEEWRQRGAVGSRLSARHKAAGTGHSTPEIAMPARAAGPP